jgi:signal transduction histidine kinase
VLRVRKDGDTHWALQVRDTGIGIAKEAQAYIFEPFRQVDETMSREYGGVGLGLSIVKQLAAAMNGTVTVESKVGQGSTFTVLLPLRLTVPGN